MNTAVLIRRLWHERREWLNNRNGDSPEVKWVIWGIDICRNILHAIHKEEREARISTRPRVPGWFAADLAIAVNVAQNYLKRNDKENAMRILQKASEAIAEQRAYRKKPVA